MFFNKDNPSKGFFISFWDDGEGVTDFNKGAIHIIDPLLASPAAVEFENLEHAVTVIEDAVKGGYTPFTSREEAIAGLIKYASRRDK